MEKVNDRLIEWGVAFLALPGQSDSVDRHWVKVVPPHALVAVMDGLGHGEEAAAAANTAVQTLEASADKSVTALVRRCHEQLSSTRGAVMSVASFNALDNTVTWIGVGNVEGLILHYNSHVSQRQETLLLRSGVVGDQLPPLETSTIKISEYDLLIFATDGIRPGFAGSINPDESPKVIAGRILSENSGRTDDALVLVVRYTNGQDRTSF